MRQNLTLAIDEQLLNEAKILAIRRRTTITALVRQYLMRMVDAERKQQRTVQFLKSKMKNPTIEVGKKTWTRDDIQR